VDADGIAFEAGCVGVKPLRRGREYCTGRI
jgi:hypothetical protein